MHALPYTYRLVEPKPKSTVKIIIEGEAGGEWFVTRRPEHWELTENEVDLPVLADIAMDQDVAWKLFTHALTREQASDSVVIRGQRRLGSPIFSMLAVMA